MPKILPTLPLKSGLLPTFIWVLTALAMGTGGFCPEKVGFCPVLFQKWAAGNRWGTRLCGLSAHFPTFFSYLIAKKNKEIYKSERKKWATGQSA